VENGKGGLGPLFEVILISDYPLQFTHDRVLSGQVDARVLIAGMFGSAGTAGLGTIRYACYLRVVCRRFHGIQATSSQWARCMNVWLI
jgi:hypothetical protein